MFDSNYELCYMNTIAWSDILTGPHATTEFRLSDPSQPSRLCKYISLEQHLFHAELIQIVNNNSKKITMMMVRMMRFVDRHMWNYGGTDDYEYSFPTQLHSSGLNFGSETYACAAIYQNKKDAYRM